MIVIEKIQKQTALLPESLQNQDDNLLDSREWSRTSLAMAMRGMEDDDEPEYSMADLKKVF